MTEDNKNVHATDWLRKGIGKYLHACKCKPRLVGDKTPERALRILYEAMSYYYKTGDTSDEHAVYRALVRLASRIPTYNLRQQVGAIMASEYHPYNSDPWTRDTYAEERRYTCNVILDCMTRVRSEPHKYFQEALAMACFYKLKLESIRALERELQEIAGEEAIND